ncbi:glutamate N-acetyltransferase [Geoglobus ahangari]|uniref:Arginine biosynthesis bifunctional protein ArgJ n=1 Tax=Geoglobus ahangari TaxID=113653 RepID=A0A0F7IDN0_9EURY|nr:bifunctional ornithine acetyltransferase/N-acetylglutamate synthase [Geoglobus ahangari]AKG91003.1 glutamate N-acetyltransferase [Geoglobus ahangari]
MGLSDSLRCYGIREGKTGVGIAVMAGRIFAVYTQNRIRAAPVIFNLQNLGKRVKGIIVNSGNANAYTGEEGLRKARRMAEFLAERLNCDLSEIAIASTGVIGRQLDVDKIIRIGEKVLERLGGGEEHINAFARAIMTTDRFPKIAKRRFGGVEILGIAKGAGMIAPNMATMLAFIFTNARCDGMEEIFREAVEGSFNRVIVDGDTSTNDTVFMVASEEVEANPEEFREHLSSLMLELAEMMARDGEGATKVFWVRVSGARSDDDALRVARAVAGSNLVKTAVFGGDPNFGRIIAAIGYSGADVDERITLKLRGESGVAVLVEEGNVVEGSLELAERIMKESRIEVLIDLHRGSGEGYAIGCDLTHDYVELNSKYTT